MGELDSTCRPSCSRSSRTQRLRPLGSKQEVKVDVQLVAASNRGCGAGARGDLPRGSLPPARCSACTCRRCASAWRISRISCR
ncbi:MAG: hypothetical protein U0802_05105 [Candidatus Binatia bacterium]